MAAGSRKQSADELVLAMVHGVGRDGQHAYREWGRRNTKQGELPSTGAAASEAAGFTSRESARGTGSHPPGRVSHRAQLPENAGTVAGCIPELRTVLGKNIVRRHSPLTGHRPETAGTVAGCIPGLRTVLGKNMVRGHSPEPAVNEPGCIPESNVVSGGESAVNELTALTGYCPESAGTVAGCIPGLRTVLGTNIVRGHSPEPAAKTPGCIPESNVVSGQDGVHGRRPGIQPKDRAQGGCIPRTSGFPGAPRPSPDIRGTYLRRGPRGLVRRTHATSKEWKQRAVWRCLTSPAKVGSSKFIFGEHAAALTHNADVIKKITCQKAAFPRDDTVESPGFEFSAWQDLAIILHDHPALPVIRELAHMGVTYPTGLIDEDQRAKMVEHILERGNHAGHLPETKSRIREFLNKELRLGYIVPVSADFVRQLAGAELCPTYIVVQMTVQEDGTVGWKHRPCHDLSYEDTGSEGFSVNGRHDMNKLPHIQYGHAFLRFVHYLAALRKTHPGEKIYIQKYDADGAFKRLNLSFRSALQSITAFEGVAYIPLRMPFGAASASHFWGAVSECMADVANDELLDGRLPILSVSPSRLGDRYMEPEILDEKIKFATAGELIHSPKLGGGQKVDVFVDDFFGLSVDRQIAGMHSTRRLFNVVTNVFDVFFNARINLTQLGLTRNDAVSLKKLEAEGRPSERKTVLGWVVNTRSMEVHLPRTKVNAWSQQVRLIMRAGKCSSKDLERLIGKMVRTSMILPGAQAFIVHFRKLRAECRSGTVLIDDTGRTHLNFWLRLFKVAGGGTQIASLLLRMPSLIFFTDACAAGLGGYCHNTGRAWRYSLPENILSRTTINHLEFLAYLISPILLMQEKNFCQHHILCWMDNTNAVSWTSKAPRSDGFAQFLFETQATLLLERRFTLWGSHVSGSRNFVADRLSRDVNLAVSEVLENIVSDGASANLTPSLAQIQVVGLPVETRSWLSSVLSNVMCGGPWSHLPRVPKHTLGQGGGSSAVCSRSRKNSTDTLTWKNRECVPPSWRTRGGEDFVAGLTKTLLKSMSEKSSEMLERPSRYVGMNPRARTPSEAPTGS